MTNPLSLKNLKKNFGSLKVLDGIDLELHSGEIFGLVGLNGVGKTTMIKIILGLLKADSGDVAIFGKSNTDPAARKALYYLPEKFAPSIYLKGTEFISLTAEYHDVSLSHAVMEEMAVNLDLRPDALHSRVSKYSKGMGQKSGLIGALLSGAPLLILDEPMSGLDPKARILLKNELRKYRDNGGTIFFSSHILADLEEICDRIAVLSDTKIIYDGKADAFVKQHNQPNLEHAFLKAIGC